MIKFIWDGFTEDDLMELNRDKLPDIYGIVIIKYSDSIYIADIEWETKSSADRNGISINVYESNENHLHVSWIDDLKTIVRAKKYQLFKKRCEKEIEKAVEYNESRKRRDVS